MIYDTQALQDFMSNEGNWVGDNMYIKVPLKVYRESANGETLASYEYEPSCIQTGPFKEEI